MPQIPLIRVAPGLLLVTLAVAGCSGEQAAAKARISAEYDKSGKLQLLKYDSQGTGRVDTWSYMDGARVVRIEIDTTGDDTIDRWEYYGDGQKLEKVGVSRRGDGVVDAWSFAGADGSVERIEVSTRRNGAIDRTEYYKGDVMLRAEEDSDGDGSIDKWETYEDLRLKTVAFDTLHRGMPDRRLTYGNDGSASLELDRAGDGRFVPSVPMTAAAK